MENGEKTARKQRLLMYLKAQDKKKEMEIDCSMEDQITTEEMFARFPKLRIKIHIPRFSQRIHWSRKILKVGQLSK